MKNLPGDTIFKICIFLLIVCSFQGCKKDAGQGLSYALSADALAFIQFSPGKYFIYKDSTANKTDSIVITLSLLQTYNTTTPGWFGSTVPVTYQQYTLGMTEIDSGLTTVWLSGNTGVQYSSRVQLVSSDNAYNFLFQDITTNIPVMVVEGKTYTNVNLTSNVLLSGFGADAIISSYYWAKGVGLIKRIETKGLVTQTYTLLRSN